MNEQLIVKNFGPIKDATVDFKRVTVFIGPTGGGKSTLAKLAAIFRNDYWQTQDTENEEKHRFDELLNGYQMQDYIQETGKIEWKQSDATSSYTIQQLIHSNKPSKRQQRYEQAQELLQQFDRRLAKTGQNVTPEEAYKLELMHMPDIIVCYIPAERAFSGILANSLAGLMLNKVAVPEVMLHFLNEFNRAQSKLYSFSLDIPFLQVSYRMYGKQPRLDLGIGEAVELGRSASGMQAVVPMMLIINDTITGDYTQSKFPHSFIIEEPELNLYPTAQQGLLNWLVEKCTKGENDLTITTHSPYILSSCNLLLEAYKVAQQRPDLEAEIAAIVPKECWLNPDEFAAYYVADGTVKPITDERTHLIGGNELDAVSGDISDSFRQLLRLQKQKPASV